MRFPSAGYRFGRHISVSVPALGIHFVSPYGRDGASSRVRMYEWLERLSLKAEVHTFVGREAAGARQILSDPLRAVHSIRTLRRLALRGSSTIFIHREASPLTDGRLEKRLLTNARFGVYDFDDALYCSFGSGLRVWRPKAPKVIQALLHADRVIAGNATLADFASQFATDVRVIPSCVEVANYTPKRLFDLHDPPRLGWLGSPSGERYLRVIEPALYDLHGSLGVRLLIMGSMKKTLGALESVIDRVPWSEIAAYQFGALCDVGIMPLLDEPYERGKCGYKLLQYGAMGLPFVGSPVGVNSEILAGASMFAPETPDEWQDALLATLTMSKTARGLLGLQGRTMVENLYSYDSWQREWCRTVDPN